jgi:hypothetical protein
MAKADKMVEYSKEKLAGTQMQQSGRLLQHLQDLSKTQEAPNTSI